MKCLLCGRAATVELCRYHQEAREAVEAAYPRWREAYGELGRKAYLDRVITNGQSGQWAKEVARLLVGRLDD